ncbi:unnamed protein product [Didymodactylos carnosus]|uniref:Uncharacterized protein n=1 Tax=Didymodactylos carnosus TaxID=1234261 RepID=A0A8S2D7N6_9BILA|nr:unnamed protein product [Didymodactylos carnosus]CAF3680107.1 unnamed protein product [Didymodactylos carnosus]
MIYSSDSDSSEKHTPGKPSRLRIAEDVQDDSSDDEQKKPKSKQSERKKKEEHSTRKRRSRNSINNESRSREEKHTGLNGSYWQTVQYDRHNANTSSASVLAQAEDSSDSQTDVKNDYSHNSTTDEPKKLKPVIYRAKTYVTCRSPDDSFFVCQVLHNVYRDTKKIKILWLSSVGGDNQDNQSINENTRFKLDFVDWLDPHTVLTGIVKVKRHNDRTISLRKEDIAETKRLLQKSINGEPLSSSDDSQLDSEDENNEMKSTSKIDNKQDDDWSSNSDEERKIPVLIPGKKSVSKLNKPTFNMDEQLMAPTLSPPKASTSSSMPKPDTLKQIFTNDNDDVGSMDVASDTDDEAFPKSKTKKNLLTPLKKRKETSDKVKNVAEPVTIPKTSQKNKLTEEKTKQPKKRARKTDPNVHSSDGGGRIRKRRRTQDISEVTDENTTSTITKKSPKKTVPATPPKSKMFRVQSNRFLKENVNVTTYRKEPFFEDSLPVPYISTIVQGKLAIRAVLLNDHKLLKTLIDDVDRVYSIHLMRGIHNEYSAVQYAIQTNNLNMLKEILDDIATPKKDRCPRPTMSMTTRTAGTFSMKTLGFRTIKLTASRGAKEGNNALNKDELQINTHFNINRVILYALKNDCTIEAYDLLVDGKTGYGKHYVYENIYHAVRSGNRKLAAHIIEDIEQNAFHGFNYLHKQVLLYDNEDITINRASSVLKKTKHNSQITPVHCAAINPNSKYLKQLLTIMPEINILDKYERRPIHFAAACEGPEPLEYLLSRQANFNDCDRGGNTPLHIACEQGRAINAEILLRTAKEKAESNEVDDTLNTNAKFGLAGINRPNKARMYPIHLAVMKNNLVT